VTRDEIIAELESEIDGGSALFDIFLWLEENPTAREDQACDVFDSYYFVCKDCGWTLPMSSLAYDAHDDICEDCYQPSEDLD